MNQTAVMAGKTYTGTYSTTILLTNTAQNPVSLTGTITANGSNAASDSGFYSNVDFAWSISNLGRITVTGATSYGIALLDGGTITNGAVGSTLGIIHSDETGILLTGASGALTNDGSIFATAGRAVFLQGGGTITNGATGATQATIEGGFEGVAIYNANGRVTNFGTILQSGSAGFGIELYAGTVNNLAGGLVGGIYGVGFVAQDTPGTLTNAGVINGRGRDAVALTFGGTVTNSGTLRGTIGGVLALYATASVTNSGTIIGTYAAIDLLAGGTVSNTKAGHLTGGFGISIGNGDTPGLPGTVINSGSIAGTSAIGVSLNAGGSLTNSGAIYGEKAGAAGFYAMIGISNTGSIGGSYAGIDLLAGGTIANAAGGTISAGYGIILGSAPSGTAAAPSTLTNAGVITGTGTFGAKLLTDGSFINESGGTIRGGQYGAYIESVTGTLANYGLVSGVFGVYGREVVANGTQYPGRLTVLNAGTITGTGGVAVSLFASHDLLIDEPGAVFNGSVIGGGGTLELAAGTGTLHSGSIGALSTSLASFASITVDSGATWTLTGTLAASETLTDQGRLTITATTLQDPGLLTGAGTVALQHLGVLAASGTQAAGTTIAFTDPTARLVLSHPLQDHATQLGFAAGNTIYLSNTPFSAITKFYSGTGSSGTLTLDQSGSAVASLLFAGAYTAASFTLAADPNGGTDILIPCFLAGTCIATEHGEARVEKLRPGMRALTESGCLRPIAWIGRRTEDLARHPDPDSARPIRIARGAFAPNRPQRDLLLSPDHAVLHAGVLIPVHLLLNGTSIRREPVGFARYYHVELDRHDILLAENLPVESYLDTGNRALLGTTSPTPRPAATPCRPIVLGGPAVARARRDLLARARQRPPMDCPLRLHAAGAPLPPARHLLDRILYLLPEAITQITLEATDATLSAAILDGQLLRDTAYAGFTPTARHGRPLRQLAGIGQLRLPPPTGHARCLELILPAA